MEEIKSHEQQIRDMFEHVYVEGVLHIDNAENHDAWILDKEPVDNFEENEPLSEEFVWDDHMWECLWPKSTGLPAFVFIDVSRVDKSSKPMIMFYPHKKIDRLPENARFYSIPMAICDNPYIPEEYKNRKHDFIDEELNQIKEWVVKYKDIINKSNPYIQMRLKKMGAFIKKRS